MFTPLTAQLCARAIPIRTDDVAFRIGLSRWTDAIGATEAFSRRPLSCAFRPTYSTGHESECFVQVVVGGNARAARGEFLTGTLVDRYVPADFTKE